MKHYIHDNGRRCTWDGTTWRHWDHEQPEPGPRDVRNYECNMDHLIHRMVDGPLPEMTDDRGDFGMPTIGFGPGKVWEIDPGNPPTFLKVDMPEFEMTVTQKGISIVYGENGLDVNTQTAEAEFILAKVLPRLLEDFLNSNAKYARAQTGHDLGSKGIIPDINRKTSVLISRLWFGEFDAGRDSTPEIIDDLIGHLLLMRAKLAQEE